MPPLGIIRSMISRRDFLKVTGQTAMALGAAPLTTRLLPSLMAGSGAVRCINVVNFIRGVEPRFETDLLLPVQKQMELILANNLPASWLIQFDALVAGPFVSYLKAHMAKDHEVGFWFEMNQMLCEAAKVEWRGRKGYEWDHLPPVAFTIGYTPEERIKLADTAMSTFKSIWGHYPKSIASWNLDAITMAHLTDHYGIDAYAVCRDQIATDGFTIWGSPIAGYYPSKINCWSPALKRENQISTPVFRMLGQDPVYYYHRGFKIPSGRTVYEPDTMEPTWTAGRSRTFIESFLKMISDTPTMKFAYAQLGQENSFSWDTIAEGFPIQMKALAELRQTGKVHVETMGESGRRFKASFKTTPAQSQIMLTDPQGNSEPGEKTIWYQSRFYRANLHVRGDYVYLRDITVYSDLNPQPFLTKATRLNDVEQRMPAILDGYHWSKNPSSNGEPDAKGSFKVGSETLRLTGMPKISEHGNSMTVELPVLGDRTVHVVFDEDKISASITPKSSLTLLFEWDMKKSAVTAVRQNRVDYRWNELDYSVRLPHGEVSATGSGWKITNEKEPIVLELKQAT